MTKVLKRDGNYQDFNLDKIKVCLERNSLGLNIDIDYLLNKVSSQCSHGTKTSDINKVITLEARTRVTYEPDYSYFAARILLDNIYKDVFQRSIDESTFLTDYRQGFIDYINKNSPGILYPEMKDTFDLEKLSQELIIDNDYLYNIVGLSNLSDRYLLKENGVVLETPQYYHMRIAMGISYQDKNPTDVAIELYKVYSHRHASGSSPILFNSGTRKNLISCFLSDVDDSLYGIFDNLKQNAKKSQHAGGLSFHDSKIRSIGSKIKSTRGTSSGLIPWLKLQNDLLLASNQSGLRRGSGCAYIEPWHLEVESFIELRKATGDERRRTHDLNIALWCSDVFFERAEADEDWTLFDPAEVPLLTESYGKEFKTNYLEYEHQVALGNIKLFKKIKAKDLMRIWIDNLFGSSHPWMTFKDRANQAYPNKHRGIIRGSNLCCVTGDQLVPTQFGLKTVKELADNFPERDLIIPGLNGNVYTTPMYKTLLNQPIFKIVTESGYTHKVTGDHPVWTDKNCWVNAENLLRGDYIRVSNYSRYIPIDPHVDSPEQLLEKLRSKYKTDFTYRCKPITICSHEEAHHLKLQLQYCGIFTLLESVFNKYILSDFKPIETAFPWEKVTGIYSSAEEDVYCVKVLYSKDNHKGWTCNGLITKNTEIMLHSQASKYDNEFGEKSEIGETAVCCLHPVNISTHFVKDSNDKYHLDTEQLRQTVRSCIRALDNTLSVNHYLTAETKKSAMAHRAIGLGMTGWADVYYLLDIPQDSPEAIKIANDITEVFTFYAIEASADLAEERGSYPSFEGSLWSQGILPIDTWREFYESSPHKELLSIIDFPETCDWEYLRNKARKGMRNSTTCAIAPTASTAYLLGTEQSIEPSPSVFWKYENLSGITPIANTYFIEDLKRLGIWSIDLVEQIRLDDGNLLDKNLPEYIKQKYNTAFDRDMETLIYANAARQKWIDQGISFNLYTRSFSKKNLANLYLLCWKLGFKSTYYLRMPKVSNISKQELTISETLFTQHLSEQELCSINNKEACEMCQ